MKRILFLLVVVLLFSSHDMYLKLDTYFLSPNTQSNIHLYNGTFDKSENVIDRNRMLDASFAGNNKRYSIEEGQWSEKDSITTLNFNSGKKGTWVVGVSTKPRIIEMDAESFNNYLEHDGVKDMLAQRKTNNTLTKDAVEEYSKHVKAIFQVGDSVTKDWKTVFGYPIEFLPLENPYEKHTGDSLKIQLLRNGKPLANQLVYADYRVSKEGHTHNDSASHSHNDATANHTHQDNHSHQKEDEESMVTNTHTHDGSTHSHESKDTVKEQVTHTHDGSTHSHEVEKESSNSHSHETNKELRTNKDGVLNLNLSNDGIWYLRTIHLVESEKEGLTHESNWATLTFEVKHTHTDSSNSHAHEEGISDYVFWISSIVIIALLFFWFNRKNKNNAKV